MNPLLFITGSVSSFFPTIKNAQRRSIAIDLLFQPLHDQRPLSLSTSWFRPSSPIQVIFFFRRPSVAVSIPFCITDAFSCSLGPLLFFCRKVSGLDYDVALVKSSFGLYCLYCSSQLTFRTSAPVRVFYLIPSLRFSNSPLTADHRFSFQEVNNAPMPVRASFLGGVLSPFFAGCFSFFFR